MLTNLPPHKSTFEVRDYECDQGGVVNNAVYQNYLEHARHKFLQNLGIDYAELSSQGINLVLRDAKLKYVYPLKSKDKFTIDTTAAIDSDSAHKLTVDQTITKDDGKVILKAIFNCTSINNQNELAIPTQIKKLLLSQAM